MVIRADLTLLGVNENSMTLAASRLAPWLQRRRGRRAIVLRSDGPDDLVRMLQSIAALIKALNVRGILRRGERQQVIRPQMDAQRIIELSRDFLVKSGAGTSGSLGRMRTSATRGSRKGTGGTGPPGRRASASAEPPRTPTTTTEPRNSYVRINLYYGTHRRPTGNSDPNHFYGAARSEALLLGRVQVSIPNRHKLGRLEAPRWYRFELRERPHRHVVLLDVSLLSRAAFVRHAASFAESSGARHALVFVHGYNVTFRNAARRAAQMVDDLKFRGVPLFYSWPSKGKAALYTHDEATIAWAQDKFEEFLELVSKEIGVTQVHVVAHSMGNRAVIAAVDSMLKRGGSGASQLRELIYAAPDEDAGRFRNFIRSAQRRRLRHTLYAHSGDRALAASSRIHGQSRAGLAGEPLVVAQGMDTIDATSASTEIFSLRHSIFGDERSILSDVAGVVNDRKHPADRVGLKQERRNGRPYWLMVP